MIKKKIKGIKVTWVKTKTNRQSVDYQPARKPGLSSSKDHFECINGVFHSEKKIFMCYGYIWKWWLIVKSCFIDLPSGPKESAPRTPSLEMGIKYIGTRTILTIAMPNTPETWNDIWSWILSNLLKKRALWSSFELLSWKI